MINFRSLCFTAIAFGAASVSASAQYASEAINWGNMDVQGTARSMGFGNTLGSVGGDFSSLSVNPAGIGVYRNSEFSITPSLKFNGASSQYLGTTTTDNNTRATLNNFGLVFTHSAKGKRYDRAAWKSFSFALGANRVADFNHTYTYQGKNTTSSQSQAFEQDLNRYPEDTGYASLQQYGTTPGYIGYQSYLVNPGASGFYTVVPYAGGVDQMRHVEQTGGITEYLIAFGGNYKEKLLLGMTIGIPYVSFHSNSYYQETLAPGNTAPNPYNFNSYTFSENLDISGGGINAKIGAIYKITDYLRVGAAFHSPTYFSFSDTYDPSIVSNVNNNPVALSVGNNYFAGNQFDYHFTTPWKGILSATFLFKQYGFVSVDYEYVDYNSMRYHYGSDYATDENQINQDIKNMYKGASNLRIGAEGVINKFFMVRLGGGYYSNPYKNSDVDASRVDLSAGVGFHFKHFFTDLGFIHSKYKGSEQPYSLDYNFIAPSEQSGITAGPVAKTDYSVNNLALTLGFKF